MTKRQVIKCPRCGEDHESVSFYKFSKPITEIDGLKLSYPVTIYGFCPFNEEPMFGTALPKELIDHTKSHSIPVVNND